MVKERNFPLPLGLVFPLLLILSALYAFLIRFRNYLYDKSLLKIQSVDVRVISVGNITVGGTGKTPLVQYLARKAFGLGCKPGVLARGYKGRQRDGRVINDEGMMLLEKLPDLVMIQDPDRLRAARTACSDLDVDFLILDDGFQHRRMFRDLDIVLIDVVRPFGFGRILPAGLLREPLSVLKRASVLVLTRCDQVAATHLQEVEGLLRKKNPDVPIFKTEHTPLFLRSLDGIRCVEIDALVGRKVYLFCGIANPLALESTVLSLGAVVTGLSRFSDHHEYKVGDWESVKKRAGDSSAEMILTTAKDGVKLSRLIGDGEALVLEVGIKFRENEKEFIDLVFGSRAD